MSSSGDHRALVRLRFAYSGSRQSLSDSARFASRRSGGRLHRPGGRLARCSIEREGQTAVALLRAPAFLPLPAGGVTRGFRPSPIFFASSCRLARIRRHHRIVGPQPPLRPVLLRRHAVGGHQMPLQHLQLLAVLKADDVVVGDRPPDRHRRRQLDRYRVLARGKRVAACRTRAGSAARPRPVRPRYWRDAQRRSRPSGREARCGWALSSGMVILPIFCASITTHVVDRQHRQGTANGVQLGNGLIEAALLP